jgi:secretion system chaperone SscA
MSVETLNSFEPLFLQWVNQLAEGNNPFGDVKEVKIQETHALAYCLYRKQEYLEASHLFRLLVSSRPSNPKYWKGLGACLQMLKDYEEALNCYISAKILNQGEADPYLYLYAADCYFALKEIKNGLKALKAARLIAEETNDTSILQHVKLMREFWSKK